MPTPTTLTIITLTNQFTSLNGQTAEFYIEGYLVNGGGIPGKSISLSWQEDDLSWVALGSATTDAIGWYGRLVQVPFGIRDVRAVFAGDGTYDPSNAQKTLTITGLGQQQLRALFWVTHYPKPEDIEADTYGYVLCIDPNGIRQTQPIGPLFLLLDSAAIKPGLTDRNGSIAAFLNDNQSYVGGQVKHWDMYLFRTGTPYIRDNDEFWIGVQRGPDVPPSNDPENDVWDGTGGGDGKGTGRRWLIGGYVTKRYYVYGKDTKITAVIRGKDYMDLWKDQPFGTPDIPRNYTSATDFATIAYNILTDVNITSGLGALGTPFTTDPDWWPGSGSVPLVTGIEWVKEFKREWAFDPMRDGCEQAGWEWQIDFKKEVLLYPRNAGPIVAQPLIQYSRNIRELPEICVGDTSELITNIIITDGDARTIPPEIDGWSQIPKDWPDIGNPNMTFSAVDYPAPPNIATGAFADQTLTLDDEGHPALCFIKDLVYQFNLALSFSTDGSGNFIFATLAQDLRKWRRYRLRFRHPTRNPAYEYGGASYVAGTTYRAFIMADMAHGYYYDFGKGTVNPVNRSPQLVNGLSEHDYISDKNWAEIDLLLPEADIDGTVSNANLKGWVRIGGYTGNTINYVELSMYSAEPNPGYGPSLTLAGNITAGDHYINISHPEQIAGYTIGTAGQIILTRTVEIVARQGATEEILQVKGILGASYPAGTNVWLEAAAQNNFTAGVATLRMRAGWTMCFSQLRLERNLTYEQEAISPLAPPYRYKMVTKKEMEYLNEATSQADLELAQDALPRQYVKAIIDGDPRVTIGYRMMVQLDPFHGGVFQNIPMIIDDLEYNIENQVDFTMDLLLAPSNERMRARLLTEATAFDVLFRKAQNLAQGKTPLTKGVT